MSTKVFLFLVGGLIIAYVLYLSWWFIIPIGIGVVLWKSGFIQKFLEKEKPEGSPEQEKEQRAKTIYEIINDFEKTLIQHGLIEKDDLVGIKHMARKNFTEEIKEIIYKNTNLKQKRHELLTLVSKDVDDIASIRDYKQKVLDIFHSSFADGLSRKKTLYLPSLFQSLMSKYGITANNAKEGLEKLIPKLIEDGVNSVKRDIKVNIEWLQKSDDEETITREIEDIKKELKLEP